MKKVKKKKKIGLGKVMSQVDLNSKKLLQAINFMLNNMNKYKINRDEFKKMPGDNPAHNIISVVNYAYKSKTKEIS